jgi:hypothetical protein
LKPNEPLGGRAVHSRERASHPNLPVGLHRQGFDIAVSIGMERVERLARRRQVGRYQGDSKDSNFGNFFHKLMIVYPPVRKWLEKRLRKI